MRKTKHLLDFIRAERLKRDWSLTKLSRISGISRGYLHLLEKHENSPSLDQLVKLADAFEMRLSDMFYSMEVRELTPDEYTLLTRYRNGDVAGLLQMVTMLAEGQKESEGAT